MPKTISTGGAGRDPLEGIGRYPQNIERALDVVEAGREGLFNVLEIGFDHRLMSGSRYHIDLDAGWCDFRVDLAQYECRFIGGDRRSYSLFKIEGDGFDLAAEAAKGVDPAKIRGVRKEPEDPEVAVSVPLHYLMAECVLGYRQDMGPDRPHENMHGDWYVKQRRRLSEALLKGMKSFEVIGEMGVEKDSRVVEFLLRQRMRVEMDSSGRIHLTGTDNPSNLENPRINDFEYRHEGIVGFHIHQGLNRDRRAFRPETVDEILRLSDDDEGTLRRLDETEIIFTRTDEGFAGRVHRLEGNEIKTRDILLKKEDDKVVLVRDCNFD